MHPRKYVHLSLLISEFILFGILITIFSYGLSIYNKKEFVWIGSKILTVMQILENNMSEDYPLSKIFENENVLFERNYEYLLKHSTKDNCEKNFKKCGILDTYGNIMCIPERDSCPINDIIVDYQNKKNEYTNKGYSYSELSKLPKNYYLYYTNKEIDKEIVVHFNFSDEQPKYISPQNFIFDESAYDKYLVSHYSGDSSDSGFDSGSDFDGGGGDYGGGDGGGGIGDGGGYWRNLEEDKLYGNSKLTKYIDKKFKEKKNEDIYFRKVYNNLYVKNFLGFESYEQMNILMKSKLFSLYLKMIPNFPSTIISIFCALVLLGLCIFSIIRLNYKDIPNDHGDETCITCSKCAVGGLYLVIFIGYYIYFIYAYCKIYKNPELLSLKKIKSDNFINDFINEILKGKNLVLILFVIILFSISFIFFILTWIFKPIHQKYIKPLKIETKEINKKIKDLKVKDLKLNEKNEKDVESSDARINEKNKIKDFENIVEKLDEKNNKKEFEKKDEKDTNNNSISIKEASTKNEDSNITNKIINK